MKDLRRLLDGGGDELEQALLRSAGTELPRAAGLHGAALALGLTTATAQSLAANLPSATALAAANVPAAASLTTPSAALAGSASAAKVAGAASLTLLGKGLVGGTLVSFLSLTTLDHAVGLADRPASTAATTHAALQPAPAFAPAQRLPPPVEVTPPSAASPTPAPVDPPIAGARPAPRRDPPAAPPESPSRGPARVDFAAADGPSRPSPPSSASLSAEIHLLDRARAALEAQNLAEAGRVLDLYAASRPSPVLAPEAGQLRVRLLLAAGQRREAAKLARTVIHQHPQATHAPSLRRLAQEP